MYNISENVRKSNLDSISIYLQINIYITYVLIKVLRKKCLKNMILNVIGLQ